MLSDQPLFGQTNNWLSPSIAARTNSAVRHVRGSITTRAPTNSQPHWFPTNLVSTAGSRIPVTKGTSATLADSGAHYRLWTVTPTNSDSSPGRSRRVQTPQQRVMEIGSGMNYWDGQKWTASDPSLEVSPEGDAFVANRLCYKVRLQANNLNTPGAITLTTPDGKSIPAHSGSSFGVAYSPDGRL